VTRPLIRKTWHQLPRRLLVLGGALLFALLLAEIAVRIWSPDWRLINRMLYYQWADAAAHQPDSDARIIYRLRPGDYNVDGHPYTIHINAYGARGPERTTAKPAGVYRIICVGGSNTYGTSIADGETWPAQLEQVLNRAEPGKYEVWNMGASAYVPIQMAALAHRAVWALHPDLVIFAISNRGPRAFLNRSPPRWYFDHYPELWNNFFTPECLSAPDFLGFEQRLWLVRHYRTYRYLAAFYTREECGWMRNPNHEPENVAAARKFFAWAKGRVKLCLFFCPAKEELNNNDYLANTDLPALVLRPYDKPAEYWETHPPAYVMPWYAEELTHFLKENHLLAEN